jgi:hypothetical protein
MARQRQFETAGARKPVDRDAIPGDAYTDHASNSLWLGEKLQLNVEMLKNLPKG